MTTAETEYSRALIALCKGIVAQDTQPDLWQIIRENQQLINEYVAKLGLCLLVDEVDEYAYLKQAEGENSLPRIVPRHQLSYAVSLLIVLLRKHLGEYDASNGDSRLLLTRQKIIASMRVFLQATTNEIKIMQEIDKCIDKVIKLGFLRPLEKDGDVYEVQRVLRSFVNAQWLRELDERLAEYKAYANQGSKEEEGALDGFI